MSVVIKKGADGVSVDCSELIAELKKDIAEFGGDLVVNVWCIDIFGTTVYVNYNFIIAGHPVRAKDLDNGTYIKQMTMTALLVLFEKETEAYMLSEKKDKEDFMNGKKLIKKMAVDEEFLQEWYQHSVLDEEPVWTDNHISEVTNNFYLIPREVIDGKN